jgi:hypothetical protein
MKDSKSMFNCYETKVNPELTEGLGKTNYSDFQEFNEQDKKRRSSDLSDWFGVIVWFIGSAFLTAAFILCVVKGWIG